MTRTSIQIGIVGGAGYTGGELVRLLLNHDHVTLKFVQSRSQAGKFIYEVHTDLLGDTSLKFESQPNYHVDLIFLCLPHGESRAWLHNNKPSADIKIIDLGNDYRVDNQYRKSHFTYGLSELNIEKIKKSNYIANPGCFATAIQLALLPLATVQLLSQVSITGITGATGAGQSLSNTSHFAWRTNNVSAYKTLTHQHLTEINKTLDQINQKPIRINFVPWRGDFARGIFCSSTFTSNMSLSELKSIYESFYENAIYVHVSENNIDLKQVVNTNKCLLHIEKEGDQFVVHSIIDNLIKGAAGQAIQNMNLMYKLPENTGLKLKSIAF